jgi:hypothetical protein
MNVKGMNEWNLKERARMKEKTRQEEIVQMPQQAARRWKSIKAQPETNAVQSPDHGVPDYQISLGEKNKREM